MDSMYSVQWRVKRTMPAFADDAARADFAKRLLLSFYRRVNTSAQHAVWQKQLQSTFPAHMSHDALDSQIAELSWQALLRGVDLRTLV